MNKPKCLTSEIGKAAWLYKKSVHSNRTKMQVVHLHDPSLNKLGKILHDGGLEANALWDQRAHVYKSRKSN